MSVDFTRSAGIKLIMIFLALLLIGACATEPSTNSAKTVKIGAVLPLTGWAAYWGVPASHGIDIAVDEIRAQGGSVEIVLEDSKMDASTAATIAHKLISVDDVDAAFVEFAGPSVSSSPIFMESKTLFMYDAFVPQPVRQNPYSFKLYHDPYTECKALAKIALAQHKKNVAGVITQLDFAKPCEDGILEVYPSAQFYEYQITETDFRTVLSRIKASDAEAIIGLGYEGNFLSLFNQKKELGVKTPIYCGPKADCMSPKITALGDEAVNGTILFDFEIAQDFQKKYLARWPNASITDIQAAATDYDAIMFLYKGIASCDSRDIDCAMNSVINSSHQSAVVSDGFRADRTLAVKSQYELYTNNTFTRYSP